MDYSEFLSATVNWWDVTFAVIAFIVGLVGSRFAKRGTERLVARIPNITPIMVSIAARIAQYTVLLFGVGVGLAFLGANVQPLLAMVIIAGVIAIFILRGIADNFAAGVLIQARRPVVTGEEIMVVGPDDAPIVGVVLELTSRTVIMRTYDGRTVHVPNATLLSETVVNHSRYGRRRTAVQVRVALAPGADVDAVLAQIEQAAASVTGILPDDVPHALLTSVSSERLNATVQFWHAPSDGVSVTTSMVQTLSRTLRDAGMDATVASGVVPPPLTPMDSV